MSDHRPTRIKVRKRDGTETLLNPGPVNVVVGEGLGASSSDNRLTLSSLIPPNKRKEYFRRNFEAIVNRADDGEFTFSPSSPDQGGYYLGRLQGQWALHNQVSLTGGPTFRWEPRWNEAGSRYDGLILDDIGRPDIDCDDYLRLKEYVDALARAYDEIKDQILQDPESHHPEGVEDLEEVRAVTYGLHKQYQATLAMWNYLVQTSAVVFNVSMQQGSLFIQGRYTNRDSGPNQLGGVRIHCRLVKEPGSNVDEVSGTLFPKVSVTSSIKGNSPVLVGAGGTQSIEDEDDPTKVVFWTIDPIPTYNMQAKQEVSFLSRIDLEWETSDEQPTTNSLVEVTMQWDVYIEGSIRGPGQIGGADYVTITRQRIVPLEEAAGALASVGVDMGEVRWEDDTIVPNVNIYYSGGSTAQDGGALILSNSLDDENNLIVSGRYMNTHENEFTLTSPTIRIKVYEPATGIAMTARLVSITGESNSDTYPSWTDLGDGLAKPFDYSLEPSWTVAPSSGYKVAHNQVVIFNAKFILTDPLSVPAGVDKCIINTGVDWSLLIAGEESAKTLSRERGVQMRLDS